MPASTQWRESLNALQLKDPDEETKEDGLSQHQIKISITDEESRMQRRQEQNGARAARRAVLSD